MTVTDTGVGNRRADQGRTLRAFLSRTKDAREGAPDSDSRSCTESSNRAVGISRVERTRARGELSHSTWPSVGSAASAAVLALADKRFQLERRASVSLCCCYQHRRDNRARCPRKSRQPEPGNTAYPSGAAPGHSNVSKVLVVLFDRQLIHFSIEWPPNTAEKAVNAQPRRDHPAR